MFKWLRLGYRSRVQMVVIVLIILVIDAGSYIAQEQFEQRLTYEQQIRDLTEEVRYTSNELCAVKDQYRDSLMEIARTVYEREYYNMGGYATEEGLEVTAIYEAIMNEAQDYNALLRDVGNYFNARKDYIENIPSVWPIEYNGFTSITSGFGWRLSPISNSVSFHPGIDIAGVWNAKIIATADGVVKEHWLAPGYHWGIWYDGHEALGGMVEITHAGGFSTVYGHMRETFVKEGQRVERGDVIGIMGNTGTSKGRHLHYEIYHNRELVNPIDYLQF